MKTVRIAKILTSAALASLAMMAGTSQADSWGYNAAPNAPAFNRAGFEPGRGPAFCPPKGENQSIDQRQQRQMERIVEGMRSGQLTRHEARDLMDEQRRIDYLQRGYLVDGYLSRDEWQDLNRRLDMASRDIQDEKHDFEQRGARHAWR